MPFFKHSAYYYLAQSALEIDSIDQALEAFEITQKLRKVTFYSRSKQRLWTKGEESGNLKISNNVKA